MPRAANVVEVAVEAIVPWASAELADSDLALSEADPARGKREGSVSWREDESGACCVVVVSGHTQDSRFVARCVNQP